MAGYTFLNSPMIEIHRKVQLRMPELLEARSRWSCKKVTDKATGFYYYQLKFSEGTSAELLGVEVDGQRYTVVINNFVPGTLPQGLHDHRGRFASLHFHPDLPRGTLVSQHEWNLDNSERVNIRDFTIGDMYAIEDPKVLYHRVRPIVDSYTLLVGQVDPNAREPRSDSTNENLRIAIKIILDATRYFAK